MSRDFSQLKERIRAIADEQDPKVLQFKLSAICKQYRIPKRLGLRILKSFEPPKKTSFTLMEIESMASLARANRFIGGEPLVIPKEFQKLSKDKCDRPSSSKWQRIKKQVLKRDGYACQYCGSKKKPLHCDHIMPISRGGSNDMRNLVTACQTCNLSKHDKTLEEWRPNLVHRFSNR